MKPLLAAWLDGGAGGVTVCVGLGVDDRVRRVRLIVAHLTALIRAALGSQAEPATPARATTTFARAAEL